jgi:hypothetical protein
MYVAVGALPPSPCRIVTDPPGWLPSAAVGGCLRAPGPECLALAQQVLAGAAQPYWGLPFATPYEAEILRWVMSYGYVAKDKAQSCRLSIAAGDMSIYDASQWKGWFDAACQLGGGGAACGGMVAEMGRYSVPFATWLKTAAAQGSGVVLAGRVMKIDPLTRQTSWDVNAAEFFAPVVDDELPLGLLGVAPPQVAQGIKAYLAALKAILLARAGGLGPAKELFIVYAPALANLGVPVQGIQGFGDGSVVVLPPLPQVPPFQISFPDGKGGVITISTANPPPSTDPPPGAPPVKPPDKAGLPPEKLGQWIQFLGGGLGLAVTAGTLYFMIKKKRKGRAA